MEWLKIVLKVIWGSLKYGLQLRGYYSEEKTGGDVGGCSDWGEGLR